MHLLSFITADWLGVACNVARMWLLPTRFRAALIVFVAGDLLWAVYAIPNQIWSVLALQVVFFALNIRAWIKGPRNAAS